MSKKWYTGGVVSLVVLVVGCSSGGANKTAPSTSLPAGSSVVSTTSLPKNLFAAALKARPRCPNDARTYTRAELEALIPTVYRAVRKDVSGESPGEHAIVLFLLPGREKLAAALEKRFGNAVELFVGNAPYNCGHEGAAPRCPTLQGPSHLPPGLHLTLELGASSMPASGSLNARLAVLEASSTPLTMDTGQPLIAVIVKPGTRTVVGTYGGGIAGTGFGLDLHNGQRRDIPTIVAAWRCDGLPGSTVPPGKYGVRVGISRNEGPPIAYLSPEVPLTITH